MQAGLGPSSRQQVQLLPHMLAGLVLPCPRVPTPGQLLLQADQAKPSAAATQLQHQLLAQQLRLRNKGTCHNSNRPEEATAAPVSVAATMLQACPACCACQHPSPKHWQRISSS